MPLSIKRARGSKGIVDSNNKKGESLLNMSISWYQALVGVIWIIHVCVGPKKTESVPSLAKTSTLAGCYLGMSSPLPFAV